MPLRYPALLAGMVTSLVCLAGPAQAQHWGTVWTGADQGPYPAGNTALQPSLDFAFPHADTGSHDQSFRLIIKPDLFGRQMRFRFSNAFGHQPITFDTAFVGLQMSGAAVVPGTNRPLLFGGKPTVTVQPGAQIWSDAVLLPYVHDPASPDLAGRKLAVTFHVSGDSGPITWHALALTTSYVTAPGAGAIGDLEDDSAFPNSTTSWFFLDAADAATLPDTHVIVCIGDSITDGNDSTLNGDDRWTDVLSRRVHTDGQHVAVVNQGISGNQVLAAADADADKPLNGGTPLTARLDRDVLALSGVTDVIIFEGINDLATGATPGAVADGLRAAVDRIRAKFKGVKVLGATLTSARGSSLPGYGTTGTDARRHQLNDLLSKPGLYDAVIDFDAATVDTQTGELRADFVPNSTNGGPGDKLHPNRAGFLAMGDAVDLRALVPPPRPRPRPRPAPPPPEPTTDAPASPLTQ